MPIYEYSCERCGTFEQMQRISDPPLAKCPTCKRKVRRLISNTSFQLKGSGWYVTDYARSGGGTNGSKKDKADTASDTASAKSESKGESKSESKTETKTKTEAKSASSSSEKTSS